jgi:hypothetical protein
MQELRKTVQNPKIEGGQDHHLLQKLLNRMEKEELQTAEEGVGVLRSDANICSKECYLKYRREHPEEYGGENHWNWKGGVSKPNKELRRREEYIKWRDGVFRRDNWTCRVCGYKGHDVVAHHILDFHKYPELRFDLDNGITLCRSCHKKIHCGIGEETKFKKGQFPWNKIPIPLKEELERLYWREGFSTVAIAKKYGVCHKTVRKWLKFYQIPVRSLSEARRNYFNRVAGDVESSSEAGYVVYNVKSIYVEPLRL